MDVTEFWKKPVCAHLQETVVENELKNGYPQHWKDILNCIPTDDRIVDVGCGVGAIYLLVEKEHLKNPYLGVDFSETMIEVAKKKNPDVFMVGDYRSLGMTLENDILLCNGLLDILPNGVDALNRLLKYKPKYVILSRINIGTIQQVRQYTAYTIPVLKFTFSKLEFEAVIAKNGYSVIKKTGNTFLLKRNDI